MAGPSVSFSSMGRRGFSILEILLVFTIIGVMAAVGALRLEHASKKMQKDFEAKRLVSVLTGLRELAAAGGTDAELYGYGVFFWYDVAAGRCFEYSPYVPRTPSVPNAWANAITRYPAMGLPDQPLALGLRSNVERSSLSGTMKAEGMRILFQTDRMGYADLPPQARRTYDGSGNPVTPQPFGSYVDTMVIFRPKGRQPSGLPWAQAFWTPCSGRQNGVTLPTRGACNDVIYNRIHLIADVDVTSGALPPEATIPARIRIDPATGGVRLMEQYERRADGSW